MRKKKEKIQKVGFHEQLRPMRTDGAGIDVGASEIWVDVGIENDADPVKRFQTFTADLNRMAKWLQQCGVRSVAMESTGVYWIPVCQILEDHQVDVVLVNAAHAKHVQHMQKAMTQMNLQLHHVISEITGLTGMRIIRAIVAGERNPARLAELRHETTKADHATIAKALEGDYRSEHLFTLKQCLELFDDYQKRIEQCHEQIAEHLRSLESKVDPDSLKPGRQRKRKRRNQPGFDVRGQAYRISGVDLTQVDGIHETAALGLIAEIGVDMSPWKTEKHFASWLTLSPNHKISGGKVLQRSTRKSASRARNILCMSAQALFNSRSALGAF